MATLSGRAAPKKRDHVMDELIGETIEVERAPDAPRPLRFHWRGQTYEVARIIREWLDIGHGTLPKRSHRWYNRRHRRYYLIEDAAGQQFVLYLDYADRHHITWVLARRITTIAPEQ